MGALRFVVGIGPHSVQGGLVERLLLQHYSAHEFVVVPLAEVLVLVRGHRKPEDTRSVHDRVIGLAQEAQEHYAAEAYFGVTSAVLTHGFSHQPVRGDFAVYLRSGRLPFVPVMLNDPQVVEQRKYRYCALLSDDRACEHLVRYVLEKCAVEAEVH